MAAAMVMGAAGVWTGSLWLTVEEANVPPKQMESYLKATSRDTVRSRSFTGKPCRTAQERLDRRVGSSPRTQSLRHAPADDGGHRSVSARSCVPRSGRDVNFNPAGRSSAGDQRATDQGCGDGMVEDYIEAVERVQLVE